jgi:hypothetical protein
MSNELKYSFNKLKDAEKRLEEGIKQTEDQLDRDGVIQRFEFTFELLWKTLRLLLGPGDEEDESEVDCHHHRCERAGDARAGAGQRAETRG